MRTAGRGVSTASAQRSRPPATGRQVPQPGPGRVLHRGARSRSPPRLHRRRSGPARSAAPPSRPSSDRPPICGNTRRSRSTVVPRGETRPRLATVAPHQRFRLRRCWSHAYTVATSAVFDSTLRESDARFLRLPGPEAEDPVAARVAAPCTDSRGRHQHGTAHLAGGGPRGSRRSQLQFPAAGEAASSRSAAGPEITRTHRFRR
jgi:hypothetical protein